jgi:glycopeptide antibiotics resistance protein
MILYFNALTSLVGILILIVFLIILRYRGRDLSYLFCFSVFWIYLLLVLAVTVFPVPLPADLRIVMTGEHVTRTLSRVNLIPFKYLNSFNLCFFNPYLVFREIVQNILLTIPLGFGIQFLTPFKTRKPLWLAIMAGFVIESAQLVVSLGIGAAYRVVDITDLMLNGAGVLIGYYFFRVFAWLYLTLTQRLRIGHSGLSAYIYNVVNWH